MLTDGEDHEEGFEEAAREAEKKGIKIFTIGIGTERGAPIPDIRQGYTIGYKKDNTGQVVISKLNASSLQEIASISDGDYINGSNTRETVNFLMDHISKMQKTEFESQVFADYEDQFQWFLGLALLLLVLDALILERKTQWFKRLGLFDENEDKA